ncbi:hypothetical protein PHLGIDRAFT_131283 [Phlebiopsis gigantea 11061_1 CR5-6]|uniref:Uncharacterized protein n=1 Tax=Phlebiopsis gigantea (strain 11061_1 CR5-6) TaxID=745531 RepID=A0A0C3S1L5_PHLG1|nr:hypothetical protein PHLGIDRAFT_131283 [Phlebiopsis gigantea 11061_1 CR5-6]
MLSSNIVHPQNLPIARGSLEFDGPQVPTETALLRARRPPGSSVPDWLLTGVDLPALVYAAREALCIDELPKVTYEAEGGYNRLFLLSFEEAHRSVLARVALKNARSRFHIPSAVATMSFARHIQSIPTPEVYAWNASDTNPVGAPYILQEYVSHVVEPWEVFRKCSDAQRTIIFEELARYHAAFLSPLPSTLQGIGRLVFSPGLASSPDLSDPRTYALGPVPVTLSPPWEETPRLWSGTSTSVEAVWSELYTVRSSMAMPDDQSIELDEIGLDEDQAGVQACNPSAFAAAASNAHSYIRRSLSLLQQAPADLSASCLFRSDYAFRNVLLDAKTLRVRAFIDWDDIHVKPFVLSVNFPEDITSFSREGLDPQSAYFRDGAFGVLPPDEDGEMLDILDEHGNYRAVDEHGNPTFIDEHNERIRGTRYRREYIEHLKKFDHRVGRDGTWELRKDLVRAEYLVMRGGEAWWDKREWLEQQSQGAINADVG